jgi:hypothetical protein
VVSAPREVRAIGTNEAPPHCCGGASARAGGETATVFGTDPEEDGPVQGGTGSLREAGAALEEAGVGKRAPQ